MKQVEEAKASFVRRYNPQKSYEVAFNKALLASVQRNRLYRTLDGRGPIRHFWKQQLEILAGPYHHPRAIKDFLIDVAGLHEAMNQKFKDQFVDGGFRISHSQKSLAIVLKHLWCIGEIPEPPACPVDRRILEKVMERVPPWTNVNFVKEHQLMLSRLEVAARAEGLSIAKWELLRFAA